MQEVWVKYDGIGTGDAGPGNKEIASLYLIVSYNAIIPAAIHRNTPAKCLELERAKLAAMQ
jgi:hypothetical protein